MDLFGAKNLIYFWQLTGGPVCMVECAQGLLSCSGCAGEGLDVHQIYKRQTRAGLIWREYPCLKQPDYLV